DVQPLLMQYCFECHQGPKAKAGVAFDALRDERRALNQRRIWERVLDQLAAGAMPPEGKPQPADEEQALGLRWIQSRVLCIDCSNPNHGRVTFARLHKKEYNNSIRDLFALDKKPADDLPLDDVGYVFDDIGDVLAMPPVLLERYVAAAERVVDAAIVTT